MRLTNIQILALYCVSACFYIFTFFLFPGFNLDFLDTSQLAGNMAHLVSSGMLNKTLSKK